MVGTNFSGSVGSTAFAIAHSRAVETARDDRLFDDPWAAAFVRAGDWTPTTGTLPDDPEDMRSAGAHAWAALRTVFIDREVLAAVAAGTTQVVVLGAGLDMRAARLALPKAARVFEVDTPEVLAFKEAALLDAPVVGRSPAAIVRCTADVTGPWLQELRDHGFDRSAPTVWVIEGVLIYLPWAQCDRLLSVVRSASAPTSRLAMTITPRGHLARVRRKVGSSTRDENPLSAAMVSTMWVSEGPADIAAWLGTHGWSARVVDPADLAGQYGRQREIERSGLPERRLVSATLEDRDGTVHGELSGPTPEGAVVS